MSENHLSVTRVEHKYYITHRQATRLARKLEQVLKSDEHNNRGGYYVKSLYFDTPGNADFYDKDAGVYFHQKVRLRVYDEDYSLIKLENKRKYGEKQTKDSLIVTRQQAESLIRGDFTFLLDMADDKAILFYLLFSKGYHPVVIVGYNRIAYYWPHNDIRITLDIRPQSCETNTDLFEKDLVYNTVFSEDIVILEVKYNDSLPPFIKDLLMPFMLSRQSASKYASGRKMLEYI